MVWVLEDIAEVVVAWPRPIATEVVRLAMGGRGHSWRGCERVLDGRGGEVVDKADVS